MHEQAEKYTIILESNRSLFSRRIFIEATQLIQLLIIWKNSKVKLPEGNFKNKFNTDLQRSFNINDIRLRKTCQKLTEIENIYNLNIVFKCLMTDNFTTFFFELSSTYIHFQFLLGKSAWRNIPNYSTVYKKTFPFFCFPFF